MNCLEFRRRIVIDPADREGAMLRHRLQCRPCADFAERQLGFDHTLRCTAELPVPEGLAARILLAQGHYVRDARARYPARRIALAAGLLLAFGLVSGYWSWQQWHSLERAVFAHIDDEFFALHRSETVPMAQVNEALRPVGTVFGAQIGAVRFASVCPLRKSQGAHLVLRGDRGPVTVMVLPRETVRERRVVRDTIRGKLYTGTIVPSTQGSIAVVGEDGENLDVIEARVRAGLHYRF